MLEYQERLKHKKQRSNAETHEKAYGGGTSFLPGCGYFLTVICLLVFSPPDCFIFGIMVYLIRGGY
jgi:hypothetical protein